MGDRSGEWAGQGNTEYFLFSKVFLDHVGPMWSCPILLEEHSPVVLEEEIDRPYKLLFHNLLIRGTVNPLWEAAGVISMLHSPLVTCYVVSVSLPSIHSSFRTLSLLPIRPLRGHAILASDKKTPFWGSPNEP